MAIFERIRTKFDTETKNDVTDFTGKIDIPLNSR